MRLPQLNTAAPAVLACWLGYAGLLPFAVGLLLAVFGGPTLGAYGRHLLGTYGAVILSFLGGVAWGLTLTNETLAPAAARREFLYAVLPSLLAWLALLLPTALGTALLALCFVATLGHDWRYAKTHPVPDWFVRLRVHLSLGAVGALLIATGYG